MPLRCRADATFRHVSSVIEKLAHMHPVHNIRIHDVVARRTSWRPAARRAATLILIALFLPACGGTSSAPARGGAPATSTAQGNAGTIAFDVVPTWSGDAPTNSSLVAIPNTAQSGEALLVAKSGSSLSFTFADASGQEQGISTSIDAWQPGETHQIMATWDQSVAKLYIDGVLVGQTDSSGGLAVQPGMPLLTGSDVPGDSKAETIGDFQVFSHPLSPDEIAALACKSADTRDPSCQQPPNNG